MESKHILSLLSRMIYCSNSYSKRKEKAKYTDASFVIVPRFIACAEEGVQESSTTRWMKPSHGYQPTKTTQTHTTSNSSWPLDGEIQSAIFRNRFAPLCR